MTNSEQEMMSAGRIHHPNHRTRVFALIAFMVLCLIISAFGGAVTDFCLFAACLLPAWCLPDARLLPACGLPPCRLPAAWP